MEQQDEMSFWDHLEELRWTLFRSILALFIFAIGSFAFMRQLFDQVILAPCSSDFIFYRWLCHLNEWLRDISPYVDVLPDFCNDNFHVEIFNIRLASQFFTHMTTSFWLALGVVREREEECPLGVCLRDDDVLRRVCRRLFRGVPDDAPLLGDLPVERQHYRAGVVGFLHGQLPVVDIHHGGCLRDAARLVALVEDRYPASWILPQLSQTCHCRTAHRGSVYYAEQRSVHVGSSLLPALRIV